MYVILCICLCHRLLDNAVVVVEKIFWKSVKVNVDKNTSLVYISLATEMHFILRYKSVFPFLYIYKAIEIPMEFKFVSVSYPIYMYTPIYNARERKKQYARAKTRSVKRILMPPCVLIFRWRTCSARVLILFSGSLRTVFFIFYLFLEH